MTKNRYRWAAAGDINAFFGLMLDNIADLVLTVTLLAASFQFPTSFALNYMVPGTSIGVLVGDLLFFWMAFRVAKRTGRNDVTAMPLGLDTPSTFGMVFFVVGPAYASAMGRLGDSHSAAMYAWHIGIGAIFISGLFKCVCAFGANWVRACVPRAGLLGSLAAIALVLISFMPLVEVLHFPIVGMCSLAVILTTLVARIRFPGRIPGALASLLVGATIYYLMKWGDLLPSSMGAEMAVESAYFPTEWLTVFQFRWVADLPDVVHYLPVIIPFALGTVVGGIDCTESAAAAGDEFDTRSVIGVEAVATLVASICGGVIQTTPYIGHPAYKAMGGRAAYTLATALFVGTAGVFGYFGLLYAIIPKSTVFPILIFIGLEITAQSFHATPRRHYPALALACIPALAFLALNFADSLAPFVQVPEDPAGQAHYQGIRANLDTLRILANGFIVTSLLWASLLAALIDHRMIRAAILFAACAAFSLFGIMHSPLPGSPMFLPWTLPAETLDTVLRYSSSYLIVAAMLVLWQKLAGIEPLAGKE